MRTINELCDTVRETAYAIQKYVMSNERIQGAQRLGGAASSVFPALVAFICGRV